MENINTEIKVILNPNSLDDIIDYDPTTTIIIGGETDVYKACGFYYSFQSTANPEDLEREFTEKINAVGIMEHYELQQALYNQECLRESNVSSANAALLTLLKAFNNHDYQEVGKVLAYNLEDLLSNAEKLQMMQSKISSDSTWELKAVEAKNKLKEVTSAYNTIVEEVNTLRKYKDSANETILLKEKLKDSEDTCSQLMSELSEVKSELSSSCSAQELAQLQEKYDKAEQTIAELMKAKKEEKTSEFSDTPADGKDEIIAALKQQLRKISQTQSIDVNETLPVINSVFNLNAKNLVYIKEIKRATYMNTLITWFALRAVAPKTRNAKIRTIIVVYDNLTNLNTIKYKKMDIAIDEEPSDQLPVVVTSNTSQTFLRNVIGISKYNYVVIIDRLGCSKLAVDRKDAKTYFLIDSASDISDYGLDPKRCIAYYDSQGKCAFDVKPDGSFSSKSKKERIYTFTQGREFEKLFD